MNINTTEVINRIHPLLETIEEGIDASILMLENLNLKNSINAIRCLFGRQAVQHALKE